MKGKFLLFVFGLMLPAPFFGQAAKPAADASVDFSRYEVFGGIGYTGANQVKGSSPLIGFDVGASAKLTKWFGATADFSDYRKSATSTAHVFPNMTTFLAGPEVAITSDPLTGFFHVLFGGAHTGGVTGEKPDISFAYGVGGGVDYKLKTHWSVRASGDGVVSSFVLDPNNTGASAHAHVNPRAMLGVSYHF